MNVDNIEIEVPDIEAPTQSDASPDVPAPDGGAAGDGGSENEALMDAPPAA